MPDRNEAQTRKDLIDPALEKAHWKLTDPTQVQSEIPVDGAGAEPWNGVTDYCLYRKNGEILAIVEAKRQTTHPQLAEQQARHYLNEIEKHQSYRPFAFLTNGYEIYFLDERTGKRQVYGFFSREDLERILDFNQTQKPLTSLLINTKIANRPYQLQTIKRIAENFDNGKRKSLLVMATGTGKTRTAMALIDLFLRTNQARHILFVADREALVDQGLTEGFHDHIPNEPRTRLYGYNFDQPKTERLFVTVMRRKNWTAKSLM